MSAAASNPTVLPDPRNCTSDRAPEQYEPRMIGDHDSSASKFWKTFRDEAKSHNDAQIYTLKEDMESALILVHL